MLTLSGQIPPIERREDAKASSNAAQGRVTLAPGLFVGFSFPLFYRVLPMPGAVVSPL